MLQSNDGFEIAEADLKLRGPGDLDGTLQSGLPFDLKMANLARDGHILEIARNTAREILQKDPQLAKDENAILLRQLKKSRSAALNWSIIS